MSVRSELANGKCRRQRGSNVDLLGDAQRIFKFDAKVSDSAVNLCVSEQKLNRSEISGFPVYLRCFGPVQRMSAVPNAPKPNKADIWPRAPGS